MLNRLKLIQRFASWTPKHGIQWRLNSGQVELIVYPEKDDRGIIQVLSDDTTFKELANYEIMKRFNFKFPKDFDPDSKVASFLFKEQNPMSIEIISLDNGDVSHLNNLAKNPQTNILLKGMLNKKGVYRLANFAQMSLGQARSILTVFYLKMQAQYFCRISNHTAKTQLTPLLREQIINYLCYRNQTKDQQQISVLERERLDHLEYVQITLNEMKKIEYQADQFLRWYQLGAIGVTSLHIVSFGYMIFFVDWLGWDIIQPLTFSVSCIYFLIGLRFYRKFRKDRNQQTIRDRFRHLVLSPKKLMQYQQLKSKLGQRRQHVVQTELKLKLAKNRISQQSTIMSSFK